MKDYIGQGLVLTTLVILFTILLGLIPKGLDFYGFQLREMDIFSDVRPAQLEHQPDSIGLPVLDTLKRDSIVVDSLSGGQPTLADTIIVARKDTSWFGVQVEDYTPNQTGLNAFFKAVDSIRSGNKVRVAWYGDSFVEGDILLGDLRDTLQSLWGGDGVGFVPVTSEVAQFKRTLKHKFTGWQTYSIVKKTGTHPPYGINCYAYTPSPDASFHYEAANYFRHTRGWTQSRVFYTAEQSGSFVHQTVGGPPNTVDFIGKPSVLQTFLWDQPTPIVGFAARFPVPAGITLYGASLESGPGFYLDNFSVRGNSGGGLKQLSPDFVRQFDQWQDYDLVVLQVGLNAVTNTLTNLKWYKAELEKTFAHLRHCFPDKPILIVSVADRGGKDGTELATMKSVPYIVEIQRELARLNGFLFYDLYRGMGGNGSMIRFAVHKPRWANLDYTHLTHEGGREMGLRFARLLLNEKKKYGSQ